jgi:curli biogenesis system outer membrane secretion channel CsgG
MKPTRCIVCTAACVAAVALLVATSALAQTSFAVSGRYTAQRKPRVTVVEFENTNAQAQQAKYGASVQAMLVTFLKRKSQFVVVERQKLGDVIAEWQRNQRGQTNLLPEDPTARELLEKLDAIVLGNVTLLDITAEANVTRKGDPDKGREIIRGQKIEIDAKLLSRSDGRIIAAAQRSGPVSCLRSIVERLGIALEQEFLRPYYGRLKINLTDPEYVRILLTPILLDTALDEEKPPAERSATVIIGGDRDVVEPWTTDPTSYTIENLLSGWYSMRLERPGYEGLGTENARWEARDTFGDIQVIDRVESIPLPRVARELSRFVVHVDPLAIDVIDGDSLAFSFRKKGGSLAPRTKRQYLDDDYSQKPQRVILIGGDGLEINTYEPPHEYSEDETCDLFEEKSPRPADYGKTYITSGEPFAFDIFKGGGLIFDDYRGEVLPVGQYQMTLWEPNYQLLTTDVTVRDRDHEKTTRSALIRNTQALTLATTGAKPQNRVTLQGKATNHRLELPLNFEGAKVHNGLPVDVYSASTDLAGLGGWQMSVELLPQNPSPPIYDADSKDNPPLKSSSEANVEDSLSPHLKVKTRLCMGGRLAALSAVPDPVVENVYIDRTFTDLLDALLRRRESEEQGGKGNRFREALNVTERLLQQQMASGTPQGPGQPESRPPGTVQPDISQPVPPSGPASPQEQGEKATSPEPKTEPLPRDPEALRVLFAQRLEDIDLLVLDDRDMARLRQLPEVAALVKHFVDTGGALFAFVSDDGDYTKVVGAPLVVAAKGKQTNRFEISAGEIPALHLQLRQKKVQVKSKRALPELENVGRSGSWRVVAYTKGHKDPRIVERASRDQGGYVILWGDDPESFRGRKGATVPDVEAVRTRIEGRVLSWARYLMFRRYDKTGGERQRVEKTLFP